MPGVEPFGAQKLIPVGAVSSGRSSAVLAAARAVGQSLGLPRLQDWTDLFGGDFVGVCTYPALDNYRAYRKATALGPLSDLKREPHAPSQEPSGVFAYLSGLTADLDTIVEGLVGAKTPVEAHVRDLQPGQLEMLQAKGIQVYTTPRDLYAELPRRSAIVHHAGLSTTHVAIETGTPQVVFPNSTEQVITAQRLVDMKTGLGLSRPQRGARSVAASLRAVVANPSFRNRAGLLRDEALDRSTPSALDVVVHRCNALLAHC